MAFTVDSKVGALLDNPQTKALLDQYIPDFSSNPLVSVARDISLRLVAGYSDSITPAKLAAIENALAQLPNNKPVFGIDSKIGELLDNTEAKAVLDKHIPDFSPNPLVAIARDVSLKFVSGFSGGTITPEKLAAVSADLAKL